MEFDLEYYADQIKRGGIGAFPTETVYGLGGHIFHGDALEKIFAIKGRGKEAPLSLHVSSISELFKFAQDVPREANVLISQFWPGPLAIIVPGSALVPSHALSETGTVSFRYPDCPLFLDLARLVGAPIAGTSANRTGSLSPICPQDVRGELGVSLDFILDGGVTKFKLESSIVDLTKKPFKLLREGVISKEELEVRSGIEFQFGGNRIQGLNIVLFEEGVFDFPDLENFSKSKESIILAFSPLDLPHILLRRDISEGELFLVLGRLQKEGKTLVFLENVWKEGDRILDRLTVRALKIIKNKEGRFEDENTRGKRQRSQRFERIQGNCQARHPGCQHNR